MTHPVPLLIIRLCFVSSHCKHPLKHIEWVVINLLTVSMINAQILGISLRAKVGSIYQRRNAYSSSLMFLVVVSTTNKFRYFMLVLK